MITSPHVKYTLCSEERLNVPPILNTNSRQTSFNCTFANIKLNIKPKTHQVQEKVSHRGVLGVHRCHISRLNQFEWKCLFQYALKNYKKVYRTKPRTKTGKQSRNGQRSHACSSRGSQCGVSMVRDLWWKGFTALVDISRRESQKSLETVLHRDPCIPCRSEWLIRRQWFCN